MDLLSDIEKQLKQTTAQAFLIALSGGLDSTVLLSLFAKLRQKQPHLPPLSVTSNPHSSRIKPQCRQLG